MAYGRQRRVAAILKKKREEEAARQGLNALSADNITKIVSDDANDLDQVQFTTTNGAKVNIQNQRGKTEEGQTVTPTIKTLGQSFSGGSLQNNLPQIDSLGTSYAGGSLQNNLPEPELELPQAVADFTGQPVGKSFSGGSLQNNLPQIDSLGTSYAGGSLQNNRPQINSLGQSYTGGSLQNNRPQINSLGQSYTGGATQADYGQDLDFAGQPMSTDFDGNVYDQQLNADILAEQMNRNSFTDDEGFMGTEVLVDPNSPIGTSYTGGATQANLGRGPIGTSYTGGSLQNPSMDPLGTSYAGGATQANYDQAMGDTDQFGNPVMGFDEQDMRNEMFADDLNVSDFAEPKLTARQKQDQARLAARKNKESVDLFEDLKAKGFNPTEPTLDPLGLPKTAEVTPQGHNSQVRKDLRNAQSDLNAATEGVNAGILPAEEIQKAEAKVLQAEAAFSPEVTPELEPEVIDLGDPEVITEDIRPEEDKLADKAIAEGAMNTDGTIDQDWLDAQTPDVYTGSVAEQGISSEDLTKNTLDPEVEAKESNDEIMAATAGSSEKAALAQDAKGMIEQVKEGVESGKTTIDEANKAIWGSLDQLGELLGIDGKDLTRALFRYAGARIFGSSNNSAARFAYDSWVTDNSGTTLGKNATAKQRNLAAYKSEIANIDADNTMTAEQKTSAKKTADQVFGVNKPTTMGRPVNIKGIVSATGQEEVVAGRRNESNSYDVFMDGQWVPIEESGLSEIQITGRGAEQAFERGVKDPRTGVGIDNATHVSSTGVPTFNFKTGDQRKSYQLAKRSVDSFPVIEGMLQDPKNVEKLTSALGGLSTWAAGHANDRVTAASINLALGDSLPRKYKSATSAWLQALLRADTGAAYSETEIMDYIATNIPQVGDDPDTVQFKIAQMKSTTETMAANAGQGAKYLLNRLDGSVEAPDSVKRMQEIGIGRKKKKVELNQADQDLVNKYPMK